ncbi:MAG: hypothetical protein IAE81_06890 [Caldilineaceae bacterium]|jgi:hypothetical protein|nr:hypothetical protein [Caldilineaceae bacterium]
MPKTNDNVRGVGFLLLALLTISLQTVAVKWISGDYPVSCIENESKGEQAWSTLD